MTEPFDLSRLRADGQLSRDRQEVLRQVRALLAHSFPVEAKIKTQDAAVDLLNERRTDADADVERIDLVPTERRVPDVPVKRGSTLVRAGLGVDRADVLRRLARGGRQIKHLDGELIEVLTPDLDTPGRLDRLERELPAADGECSPDAALTHLVPLNVVIKGVGGPRPTQLQTDLAPRARRGSGARVTIIDTGVPPRNRGHVWTLPLLRSDNVDLLDAFPPGHPPGDDFLDLGAGHGAFVTGVVQQVAPGAEIRVRAAVDSDGVGSEIRIAEQLLAAVREDQADIVNLSVGVQTVCGPLLALQVALEVLRREQRAVLIVAAAGNYGDDIPVWPAAFAQEFPSVVAVGALDASGVPAAWASTGAHVRHWEVGEGIVSTYVRGQESPLLHPDGTADTWDEHDDHPWAVWSGSSFAAPQVVGRVAHALAQARATEPGVTAREVYERLYADAAELPGGIGRTFGILAGTPST